MTPTRRIRRSSLISFALAVLVTMSIVSVASAAPRKPGGGGSTTTSATLVPSCNPCAAGTVVHFSGKGYDASQYKAQLDFAGALKQVAVWSDGTISTDWQYFTVPGSYAVKAYQTGSGGKLVLKAQVTVTIQ